LKPRYTVRRTRKALDAAMYSGGHQSCSSSTPREESVVLDANHPLAGMTLVFEIEMVEVVGAESA